jgi:hypothetical protein
LNVVVTGGWSTSTIEALEPVHLVGADIEVSGTRRGNGRVLCEPLLVQTPIGDTVLALFHKGADWGRHIGTSCEEKPALVDPEVSVRVSWNEAGNESHSEEKKDGRPQLMTWRN